MDDTAHIMLRSLVLPGALCLALAGCQTLPTAVESQRFQVVLINEHYVSIGYIDGQEVRLGWDTGTGTSVYDASTNLLPAQTITPYTNKLYGRDFAQGDSTLSFEAVAMNTSILKGMGVTGLIGGNILEDKLVVFDFPDRAIILTNQNIQDFQTSDCFGFTFDLVGKCPVIHVEIGGKTYTALLDTGNDETIVVGDSKSMPALESSDFTGNFGFDAFGKRESATAIKVASIDVLGQKESGVVLDDRFGRYHEVDMNGRHRTALPDPFDVNIGLGFLKNGTLALDYRTKRGFWKPHGPVVFSKKILPFVLWSDGTVIGINMSIKDNPFAVGDRIITVDGKPFTAEDGETAARAVSLLREGKMRKVYAVW